MISGVNKVVHQRHFDRHDQAKPETLTKKYAWIALHRAEGNLADTIKVKDLYSDESAYRYVQGPWVGYVRDLDPSVLLAVSKENLRQRKENWFTDEKLVISWGEDETDQDWMSDNHCVQNIKGVLQHGAEPTKWLLLQGFNHFYQPMSPLDVPSVARRSCHLWIRGYMVRQKDLPAAEDWFGRQDFSEDWMPKDHSTGRMFVGEFPWHPSLDREDPVRGWIPRSSDHFSRRSRPPCNLRLTVDRYSWGSGYDATWPTDLGFYMPCMFIVEKMKLSHFGQLPVEFAQSCEGPRFYEEAWFDESGTLVAIDPSMRSSEVSCLLFRQDSLENFLKANRLSLIWMCVGEKMAYCYGSREHKSPGTAFLNGHFTLRAGELHGAMRHDFNPHGRW